MRSSWTKAAAFIALVWLLAGGVIWLNRYLQPTPASIAAYVASHPVGNLSGKGRAKVIDHVASQMNGLDYKQRQDLRMARTLDGFFRSLSSAEQNEFLDLTLPAGFKQMMEALNRMEPEKRKQFVDRALADMKKREGDEPREDPHAQKIVQQGLRSFYSEANADVKLDVAPLIEQMQKNMSSMR